MGLGCHGGGGDSSLIRRAKGKAAISTTTAPRAAQGATADAYCSSSSCASSSSSSPFASHRQHKQRAARFRVRRRVSLPHCHGGGRGLQELALPLGMSFAAIVSQFLDANKLGQKMSLDRFTRICTSVIDESVTNIHGDRFDCFMNNFEMSFRSTLRTLRLINKTSGNVEEKSPCSHITRCSDTPIRGASECLASQESLASLPFNAMKSQMISHEQENQQLVQVSQDMSCSQLSHSMLSTFEKSVIEQTRSNDLKEFEINLTMKQLKLMQSQLSINSCANLLEKMKLLMGVSKANFKEEKLRNQMQETRYAELLKKCIDLLVAGLIIMCALLVYGVYIYSFERITEAASSCAPDPKEYKSWWLPKQVATFSSGWQMLRCHVVVVSRMSFGLLMILAIIYSLFQRSAIAGTTMPVTFLVLLLGAACGVAGKLCVDTLGGDGYCWLMYWELLCVIHFLVNVFPGILYNVLYGPVSLSQDHKALGLPYWFRRYNFYAILLLVLPMSAGLLPFAPFHEWKLHFTQKIFTSLGIEDEL